jgi:hypothetical protein
MVEDFDLDLSAVGVTGEGKLDAELGSAIKGIGIVREENVGHIAPDERFDAGERLLSLAGARAFALVIDADEVEGGALEGNHSVFLAKEFHARLRVVKSCFVFRAGVDFMVAVASPGAERSVKTANLIDAIGDRIPAPSDEITGDYGEIGAELIGHIHGAARV